MTDVKFLAPVYPVEGQRVTSTELRCRSKLQGILKEYPDGKRLLEVRCKDKWCAERGAGMVVFHYFNIETGELDHTIKYRDPRKPNSNVVKDGDDDKLKPLERQEK